MLAHPIKAQGFTSISRKWIRSLCADLVGHSLSGRTGGGKMPVRTGHCATVHAGKLLLFGGLRDDGRFLDDITTVELIS